MPRPWPPSSSEIAIPGQPSSEISFQRASSYERASASSRTFSGLKREARNSLAVRLISCCSSFRSKFTWSFPSSQPRQAEHALGDDVLEHLGGAALDRVGPRAQEAIAPLGPGPHALRSEDLVAQLRQRLVVVGPLPFAERALGTGDAGLHRRGQGAQGAEPHRLDADLEVGDPLADYGVLVEAALADQGEQVLHGALQAHHSGGAEPGALEHKRGDRDAPAATHLADDVLVGDLGLLEEDLVELGLAGDLAKRPDIDVGLIHVEDEVGDPLVLRGVLVGAGEEHAVLGLVRVGGPDLLAGDLPVAVGLDRAGLERGEVGSGLRLREALAPDLLTGEDRLEVALLLVLVAVSDDDGPAHHQAEDVRGKRHALARELLVEDRLLNQGGALAAVLLWPGETGPAGVVHLLLPGAAELELGLVVAFGRGAGMVLLQPAPDLVAEGRLGVGQGQVHNPDSI